MYPIADIVVSDIPRDFFLIFFVNEDEGVMLWIGCVVFDPILTWVVSLILAVGD